MPIIPDSGRSASPSAPATRQERLHRVAAALRGPQALAPEDHHVTRVAEHVRGGAHGVGRGGVRRALGARPEAGHGARRTGQVVERAAPRAATRAPRPERPRPPPRPRRRSARRRRRWRREWRAGTRGSRGARRCGARPCARAGRGSGPRPPARCPPPGSRRRGRCPRPARARSGRASTRACTGSGAAPSRESTRAEPTAVAHQPLHEEALLVGGLAAHERRRALARPSPGRPRPRTARAPSSPRAGSRRRAPSAR